MASYEKGGFFRGGSISTICTFGKVFASRSNVRKAVFDPKAFLANVGQGRSITNWNKGQVIFSQGEPANAIFFIQKGKVKVTTLSKQGKEAVVAILGEGDFFGGGCLAGQPLRISTQTAITDCLLSRLEKATVIRLMHDQPDFSALFLTYLLARNIRMEADLIDQLFNSREKRLARLLLLLANFAQEGRPQSILVDLNQQTLAEMIGTTRARVSFFLTDLLQLEAACAL
jgi:CRP/FNR family transcriptional regulator, cyclic AMP receptor protein